MINNTVNNECILAGFRVDKCASCTQLCQHRIALHGLDDKSGRIGNASLPTAYRGITLANSPVRESQSEIYDFLDDYSATFSRKGEPVKSLYLWSKSPGTGKTTTASALISEWIARDYLGSMKRGEQPRQFSAYFMDANYWQTVYNEFNRPRVPDSIAEPAAANYYRSMERAKMAPFAVIDDIGVRQITEGFRGDLHSLINHRVANGLPTVYTSNHDMSALETIFDARLYDRIRDMCASIEFGGTSKRGRR